MLDNLWDSKRTETSVGRLLSAARVCMTGSCAFFLFFLYFNYTDFIVTCSIATPSHNAMRAPCGPFSLKPRARASRRVVNYSSNSYRDLNACGAEFALDSISFRLSSFIHISEHSASLKRFSHNSREVRAFVRKDKFIFTTRSTA